MNEKNKELQELVNETLTTTEEYVENAILLIEKLGEDFYSNPSKENYDELINLFDGLTWIIDSLREIDSLKELESTVNEDALWNEYVQSVAALNRVLSELKKALEDKDNPLIADLLLYAVASTFKDMRTNLSRLNR